MTKLRPEGGSGAMRERAGLWKSLAGPPVLSSRPQSAARMGGIPAVFEQRECLVCGSTRFGMPQDQAAGLEGETGLLKVSRFDFLTPRPEWVNSEGLVRTAEWQLARPANCER